MLFNRSLKTESLGCRYCHQNKSGLLFCGTRCSV